jgi:hypothetical protein
MTRSTRPLKMSEAFKLVKHAGGVVTSAGKHLKVSHPSILQTFTLPYGGSRGRPTLSPGISSELRKYLKLTHVS